MLDKFDTLLREVTEHSSQRTSIAAAHVLVLYEATRLFILL